MRELRVGLCKGNKTMYRTGLKVLALSSGRAFMSGTKVPSSV